MRHPLDGVQGKIGRAKKHLDELERDIDTRRKRNEYGIFVYVDPRSGEQVVYAWVPYDLRVSWGLAAGDVVHNLRSALDHLVCQLIRINAPRHPCNKSEFPIYSSLRKYKDDDGGRKIEGVRAGAKKIIEDLQPKRADDPLWLIRELDNWDKHRIVQASVAVADLGAVGLGGAGYVRSFRLRTTRVALGDIEDGAELYRATMDPGVQVQTRPTIDITFAETGPGQGKPITPTLAQLIDYVEVAILPKFGLHKRKARAATWPRPGH